MTLVLPAEPFSGEQTQKYPTRRAKRDFSVFSRWEAADIAEWVETRFAPMTLDRAIVYDLTEPPRNT